ncbi:hypothetical protein B0H11DRAFT_2271055 [Mycena galericulata]|nr:hypothetical protein B0H11DRAFT_2271055 [Mycena galericulata]
MTTPSLSVEIHHLASVEDCAPWPPGISWIYRTAGAPLPSWCATGPYPFVSDEIVPLLPELSELPTTLSVDSCHDSQRLADVFDLVLSTVADVRSLIGNYGPSRSSVPFVSSLMRVLAHICAKEAVVLSEALFVRPRTATPHCGEFDGTATILACHCVETFDRDGPFLMSNGRSYENLESSLPPASLMSVDNSSESFSSSIGVPLDAHVLPGRGRHRCAILPFLCLADADNIVNLMTAVACQRLAWGIPRPAVGFALSQSGVIAKLVLSWVDPSTHIVHVVCPANSTHSVPMGVFDFTDVAAALSLTQLVLNLMNDFALISKRAMAGCENNISWQSDDIPSEDFSWPERVTRWIRDVQISSAKTSSLPPTPPSSPPQEVSAHRSQTSSEAMKEKQTRRSNSQPGGKRPKSFQSSSSFAAVSAEGFLKMEEERVDILTWLFDRNVYLGALIASSASTEDARDNNKMVALYNEMAGFVWPPSWNTNSPPAVDAALLAARDLLLNQAVEVQKKTSASKTCTSAPDDRHQEYLAQHLSTLLSASTGAFTMHNERAGMKINEAESRHDWDALLYRFYAVKGEGVSPYVLLEKDIHFNRNRAADRMNDESFLKEERTQASEYFKYCSRAQGDIADATSTLDSSVLQQALTALVHASEIEIALNTCVDNEQAYKEWLGNRSPKEPRTGKCDAILFAAIPVISLVNDY